MLKCSCRLFVGFLSVVFMQMSFAEPETSRPITTGQLLREYWSQPQSIRDEVRHVFHNLGVPLKYLNGSMISHNCRVLLSIEGPAQHIEHFNTRDQIVHPITIAVLRLIFDSGFPNLQSAIHEVAQSVVDSGNADTNTLMSTQAIFHMLKERKNPEVLLPLFFPLELYRSMSKVEEYENPISTSAVYGMTTASENMFYQVAVKVSTSMQPLLQNPSTRIYLLVRSYHCQGDQCEAELSLLSKERTPVGGKIKFHSQGQNSVELIANELYGRTLIFANNKNSKEKE